MYPFLPQAKAYASQDVTVADVAEAVTYLQRPLDEGVFSNPARHVVLYALAKALLSCLTQTTKTRLAHQKAREYVSHMAVRDELLSVAQSFFPSVTQSESGFFLTLSDYLIYGEKLVHQGVEKGIVRVEPHDMNALLLKAISLKFLDAIIQQVPPEIEKAAQQLEPPVLVRASNRTFLSLGCMQHVAQGVGQGKRFYGAMGLSIAAHKDGLTREQALGLLGNYVERCSGTQPFTPTEAKSVVEWVYGRQIGFSCKQTMDNGFEGTYCQTCPLNWKKRRA